ncbi:31875_t:CDS:2, partial [Racocetra persica]
IKNQNVLVDLFSNSNRIKNVAADDEYKIFCRKDLCEHIIQLIRVHFSVHPLIPTETPTEHINILRSSMTIESHWRAIKHNYLSEYN